MLKSSLNGPPILICLVFAMLAMACDGKKVYRVRTETVDLKSVKDLAVLSDSLVIPYLYTNVKGFDSLDLPEAKKKFITVMLPAILVARHERETDQLRYKAIAAKEIWTTEDSALFQYLSTRYRIRNKSEAMHRMQTFPSSMVLAQAAVETGWGKSRFFVEAKNVFGIWSFSDKDVRIETKASRGDKKVYLRAYDDLSGSVKDYFDVLAESNAFRGLRIIRESTADPYELIPYLRNYSERKQVYTNLLKKVIEQNDLITYDNYRLHPDYLEEE